MSITIKAVTEASRDNMYNQINKSERLTDDSVVKASEELDQKILAEMCRQDPVIENIYLRRVIKAKDETIRTLQNKLYEKQRIEDLAEIAVMKHEAGLDALGAIQLAVIQARKEGIL